MKDLKREPIEDLLGSPEAFGRVFDDFQPKIYAYIACRVNSREDAEDLTSRTFEKALRSLRSFDPERASMATWLYRIAGNLIIDHYRHEATRKAVDPAKLFEVYAMSPGDEAGSQRLEMVLNLMKRLPDSYQEVLTLKYVEGFTNGEVAEILGCSQKTLSMKIYRSLKALRKILDAEGAGEQARADE